MVFQMPMTIVVTRDVTSRTRGFLASIMPEPAPGVYASGDLSNAVRTRLWNVILDWHQVANFGSVIMIWRDDRSPGGLGIQTLGSPPRNLADLDGVLVSVW